MAEAAESRHERGRGLRRVRLGAAIALAIAAGFAAYLVLSGDGDDSPDEGSEAVAASAADLRALSDRVGHPVYWAGRRANQTYELTETPAGNIFIRYLPAGEDVGAKRPEYLTVGTYPFPNALRTLRRLAGREGSVSQDIGRGGLVVASGADSKNVYFAYPNQDLQIEVFDSQPGRAFRLVTAGGVRQIR